MHWLRIFTDKFYNLVESFLKRRTYRFLYQKLTRGWSDKVTWDLGNQTAKFLIPRIKRFKELTFAYPIGVKSLEDWNKILDDILWSLEWMTNENNLSFKNRTESRRFFKGLRLLGKHFADLWW